MKHARKKFPLKVQVRPMDEQHRILSQIFGDWKGDLREIDDVLVIGLKL